MIFFLTVLVLFLTLAHTHTHTKTHFPIHLFGTMECHVCVSRFLDIVYLIFIPAASYANRSCIICVPNAYKFV